jgi:hypothetical protein
MPSHLRACDDVMMKGEIAMFPSEAARGRVTVQFHDPRHAAVHGQWS